MGNHGARSDRGAAAVEFALVSMILVVFLLGILQFGLTLSQWLQVVHAAREGVRWAALQEDPGKVTDAVEKAADPIPVHVVITPGNYTEPGMVGQQVSVTVTFDTAIFGPLMEGIFHASGTKELQTTARQRVE